ncbi:MAG: ethanolamine ammonia-lyase reactivating factor EutA [Anaerolineaceae bacterium]|nr:ethanolamine ammonia-lyase reactivating factor EutA [Anaerolineaceae bacterium]
MKGTQNMISVGIDIGTTTTQVIFSELSLVEIARAGQIPRVDITDRKVLYESEIVFTPLIDNETIDALQLAEFLKKEYRQAGILPSQVETGAVIITGETARKKNADQILTAIADLAGDFVVTVAGPNVEGMIAGRGSGAASYSRQHFTTVTNIDIGGGSANCATFRQGNQVGSAAMNFGGRVIEITDGVVREITRAGEWIISTAGGHIQIGERPSLADLRLVTDCMADVTVHLIEGSTSPLAEKLYQTPPNPVSGLGKPLMFSGGIGYYYYSPKEINTVADVACHGDIGPLLAESLRKHPKIESYNVIQPAETQRATVLGASSQTLTLSGSTIWAEKSILPLKNVPVIRPDLFGKSLLPDVISEAISNALVRWDLDLDIDPYAISLELDLRMDYPQLVQVAQGLESFANTLPIGRPLIAIIKRDYAQVLGQTVKGLVRERPLLIIDQVGLEEGDYIDIGTPLMDGRVVPLVVKTLIFYH